jgi:hypothetical protein
MLRRLSVKAMSVIAPRLLWRLRIRSWKFERTEAEVSLTCPEVRFHSHVICPVSLGSPIRSFAFGEGRNRSRRGHFSTALPLFRSFGPQRRAAGVEAAHHVRAVAH